MFSVCVCAVDLHKREVLLHLVIEIEMFFLLIESLIPKKGVSSVDSLYLWRNIFPYLFCSGYNVVILLVIDLKVKCQQNC